MSHNKSSSSIKKVKLPSLKSVLHGLIYCIVILLLIIAIVQLNKQLIVLREFKEKQAQFLYEFTQVKEGVIQYGEDLNEMRDYLLLPTRDYSFFPEVTEEQRGDNSSSLGVYKFVDKVGKDYLFNNKQKDAQAAIKALKTDWEFLGEIKKLNLLPARYLKETDDATSFKFYQNKTTEIAALVLDKNSAEFYMNSILGVEFLDMKDGKISEPALVYLQGKLESILSIRELIGKQKNEVKKLWQSEDIVKILSEKKLQVDLDGAEIKAGFEYNIRNSATDLLLTFLIDRKTGHFILGDKTYADATALEPDLIANLNALSGETDLEKMIQKNEADLKLLLNEDAFKEALKTSHLSLEDPREDGQRIFYDLKSTDDEKIVGSIIFDNLTGDIKFFDNKTKTEQELSDILSFDVKKND